MPKPEAEDECDICGDDHETSECQETFCSTCWESVENCDCDHCEEVDAAEWLAAGSPAPKTKE